MDSFYPKFGEVELVLVDDDNDFFDPLESNFEIEYKNEDTKLQLDDTVYEENQFHLSSDESTNDTSVVNDLPIKHEISCEKSDVTTIPKHSVKVENECENSNDSFGIEDNVLNYDSDSLSNGVEVKPIVDKILPIEDNVTKSNVTKTDQTDTIESKDDIQSADEKQTKRKDIKKKKVKTEKTPAASTSKCKTEKEPNVKKKRLKEEKKVRSARSG